jgi:hypothetical protein
MYSYKYQYTMARAVNLNALADVGFFAPIVPHKVAILGAVIGNDIAATGVISFDLRPTAGSDTGRTNGTVGVLNLTTAHTGGKVVYKEISFLVLPGQEVVAEVTDVTGAADVADIAIWVEPIWENPLNRLAMALST